MLDAGFATHDRDDHIGLVSGGGSGRGGWEKGGIGEGDEGCWWECGGRNRGMRRLKGGRFAGGGCWIRCESVCGVVSGALRCGRRRWDVRWMGGG